MEIRVNIPDELAAQARARGLQPEATSKKSWPSKWELRP